MTLDEAYQRLSLMPPLEFEREVLTARSVVRGVGTTTCMLVSAALDLVEDKHVIVKMAHKPLLREARATLLGYAGAFGVTSRQVQHLEMMLISSNLTSTNPGVVMYTDHWRDPIEVDDRRVIGPLVRARYVGLNIQLRDAHTVYDRDDTKIMDVTGEGLHVLRLRHFVEVDTR